ncbi:MAG: WcaI family glycosyltransferase [Cyanobacteriota bacterium]|jgi:colanic acid biosynthesis glycosyl transferase WcaI
MRIFLYGINFLPEPVGIGKYTGELATWLAAQGHSVCVVTAQPYFPSWRLGNEDRTVRNTYEHQWLVGVDVWRCPLWVPRRPGGLTRLLHLASFALSSLPVLWSRRQWRPDVVFTIAPAFFCAPGALLLSRLGGATCHSWLHIQDFELDAAFELGLLQGAWLRGLAERWERRVLRGFERVSTISGAMARRVCQKGVDAHRAVVLPNWVDLAAIQPQGSEERAANPYRRALNLPEGALVLQYSGSMNKKQGLDLLAKVIRLLADQPNLIWLLAGEGPTKDQLAEATAGMDNVRLLPLQPADQMNDWLNLADVHLLPQKAGAADLVLPSKLLGILASGRPVVASSPASSELGQLAEQAGLRVDPEDPWAFAQALARLAEDPALRQRLGAQARQLAEERFGREAVLRDLERRLQTLVSGSRGAPEGNTTAWLPSPEGPDDSARGKEGGAPPARG